MDRHGIAISDLLDAVEQGSGALLFDGEPGIGKTTAWLAAIEAARARGFVVLSARADAAESVAAYTALGDLLGGVGDAVFGALPKQQQRAVDAVLLISDTSDPVEPRTVGAAFLSTVVALAGQQPVLIAVDDLQWVDPSTAFALGYVARRLPVKVGIVATRRTDGDEAANALRGVDARRITLQPLVLREIADLLVDRVDHPFTRADVTRISEVSGGNPFYAIELGLAMSHGGRSQLPHSLSELLRVRLEGLSDDVGHLLLGAAAMSAPTVETLSAAVDVPIEQVVLLLEQAESAGIVGIAGNRVAFTHPILAHGVYSQASSLSRRAMHRRLAAAVDQPELRARHLALGATSAEPPTVAALDEAADLARARGAPAAAAELLDLAIDLGADTPERRIRAAGHHFDGGASQRARAILEDTIATLGPGRVRAAAANLLASIVMYVQGFGTAAALLEAHLSDAADDPGLAITMMTAFAYALFNIGRHVAALEITEDAVARAERFGQPALLSRALGLRVTVGFLVGRGVDHSDLARALEFDDGATSGPVAFQPRVQHALLRVWTGDFDPACDELRSIQCRRLESGDESDAEFISYHLALVAIWRGEFDEAERIAQETIDMATHLKGDVAVTTGLTIQSTLHAYAGRIDAARSTAAAGLEASTRAETVQLSPWLIATLGFVEVSVGDHCAAVAVLQPVVDALLAHPECTEIIAASATGDAVEALIRVDPLEDAEHLTDIVERNGERLDRPWMLAIGARCRGLVLAAGGDVPSAVVALETSMRHHAGLDMPFERARSQLILGGLRRRLRHKHVAAADLRAAVDEFERLRTPLWAERARTELARVTVHASGTTLTPTQQRVAELVADGLTNRAVASALFISPKTVGSNLDNIYRKLGIHSRTELARWVSDNR